MTNKCSIFNPFKRKRFRVKLPSGTYTGLMCVKCGRSNATEGSMKHPYCRKCFKEVWDDDYDAYSRWLEHHQ